MLIFDFYALHNIARKRESLLSKGFLDNNRKKIIVLKGDVSLCSVCKIFK